MTKKTKTGFPKEAFHIFGNNFDLISSQRPCEICGKVSILKDIIDDKFVCYSCYRQYCDEIIKNNEIAVKNWDKKRDLMLGKHCSQ